MRLMHGTLALFISAQPALADWEFTKWGMSREEVVTAGRTLGIDVADTSATELDDYSVEIFNSVPVKGPKYSDVAHYKVRMTRPKGSTFYLLFDAQDKLSMVIGEIPGSECVETEREILASLGAGRLQRASHMTTRTWNTRQEDIILMTFSSPPDRAAASSCRAEWSSRHRR